MGNTYAKISLDEMFEQAVNDPDFKVGNAPDEKEWRVGAKALIEFQGHPSFIVAMPAYVGGSMIPPSGVGIFCGAWVILDYSLGDNIVELRAINTKARLTSEV